MVNYTPLPMRIVLIVSLTALTFRVSRKVWAERYNSNHVGTYQISHSDIWQQVLYLLFSFFFFFFFFLVLFKNISSSISSGNDIFYHSIYQNQSISVLSVYAAIAMRATYQLSRSPHLHTLNCRGVWHPQFRFVNKPKLYASNLSRMCSQSDQTTYQLFG